MLAQAGGKGQGQACSAQSLCLPLYRVLGTAERGTCPTQGAAEDKAQPPAHAPPPSPAGAAPSIGSCGAWPLGAAGLACRVTSATRAFLPCISRSGPLRPGPVEALLACGADAVHSRPTAPSAARAVHPGAALQGPRVSQHRVVQNRPEECDDACDFTVGRLLGRGDLLEPRRAPMPSRRLARSLARRPQREQPGPSSGGK